MHLLEAGTDLCTIQTLLGHNSVEATQTYTYVTNTSWQNIKNPLDSLGYNRYKNHKECLSNCCRQYEKNTSTKMDIDFSQIDFSYILTLVSGGAVWETVKFFYPDIKNYFEKRRKAKVILYENMDLAIKSSDELYGKLESLSREDFATFINKRNSISDSPEHNQIYVCYLVGQFWAALEHIRIQSNYSSIARLKKGKQLLRFIETIESRKFRLLDRSKQRIIGEGMIINSGDKFQIIPLYSFFDKIKTDETFRNWINELNDLFLSSKNIANRQKILVYGVIIAMFLDHFDSKQGIARRRDIYLNKLRPESMKLIQNVLLGHYLDFIEKPKRYHKNGTRGAVVLSRGKAARG